MTDQNEYLRQNDGDGNEEKRPLSPYVIYERTISRRRTRVQGVMQIVAMLVVVMLGACGFKPAENYCEEEHRKIPDAELKGKLLLSIRNVGILERAHEGISYLNSVHLTKEIEEYLSTRGLSDKSPNDEVIFALTEFVEAHPICCQLIVKEVSSTTNKPLLDDETRDGYFANFYVLNPPYFRVPEEGRLVYFRPNVSKLPVRARENNQKNISSISRAYNCGFATVIERE
jgi:hypothetical protein